jgi:hypothetical protein
MDCRQEEWIVTVHRFNEHEARLMRELADRHRELLAQLSRAETAIRAAISALCAAHGLDGDWRLAEDLGGLVRVIAHDVEASATMEVAADGR